MLLSFVFRIYFDELKLVFEIMRRTVIARKEAFSQIIAEPAGKARQQGAIAKQIW